jgi:hypothetical protein
MKRTFRLITFVMITSLAISLLPGCSFNSGTTASPVENLVTSFTGKVVPHLDEQDKVDVLIPQTGGQVSLTLANGIAFRLDIPKEALSSDQEVVMTPISSIDGMLLSGGLIAGVQLEPEGTVLLAPATLTITVPNGYDPKQMVGIAYHGQGEGFHLTPATGDGKTITLPILSFSGHGAGSGTSNSINQQAAQATASQSDGDQQAMAAAINKYIDTGDSSEIVQLLDDLFDNHIKPDLEAAITDDTKLDPAGAAFLQWGAAISLLGLQDQVGNRETIGENRLIKGLKNAFDQAYKRCLANQDVSELGNMHRRLRELGLFGDQEYSMVTKEDKLLQCGTFKLSFQSTLTWTVDDGTVIEAVVTGNVILHEKKVMELFQGRGDLNFSSFKVDFTGASADLNKYCSIDTSENTGKLDVEGRIYTENEEGEDPQWFASLVLDPHFLTQSLPKWKCDTGAMNFTINVSIPLPLWKDGFDLLHQDRKITIGNLVDSYLFSDFQPGVDGHIGPLELDTTGRQNQADVEEDLVIDVTGAPGAQ